ncbi:MAG: sulfotransferase family 2 domain-containing protein [Chloroflexota bacterium]
MLHSPLEHPLSPDDKVFFLHIPKSAGTTLATILSNYFSHGETLPLLRIYELNRLAEFSPKDYRYFRGHFYYNAIQQWLGEKPIGLTMLRKPVARFISEFSFMRDSLQQHRLSGGILDPDELDEYEQFETLTPDEFLNSDLVLKWRSHNLQSRMIARPFDYSPGDDWLDLYKAEFRNVDPVDMGVVKTRLNDFEFVGLTERFQESLFLLTYTFGWPLILDYTPLNIGTRRVPSSQFTPEVIQHVQDINAQDIETYALAEQVFDTRLTQMYHALIERYGTAAHTALNPDDLPRDTLVELLQKHYQSRFAEAHQPIHDVNISFDQAMMSTGWYQCHSHLDIGSYRWSGPGCISTIDVPLDRDQDLIIRFQVVGGVSQPIVDSLQLTINDHVIVCQVVDIATNGSKVFEGVIPQQLLENENPFVRIAFSVIRTEKFEHPPTVIPDDRLMGVALSWLTVSPNTQAKMSA